MQRICTSLAGAGYDVLLVGRMLSTSKPLQKTVYAQHRIACFYTKSFLFYGEYNLRLFWHLLFVKMDAVCAIDLDTILPCYYVSLLRGKKRVYDAHEYFSEMKEVITRPVVKKVWLSIEAFLVPKFRHGYTVSNSISEAFRKKYAVDYAVISNMPNEQMLSSSSTQKNKTILYQGAVNEARGLENLIVAMKQVDATLVMYGNGNLYDKIERSIKKNQLENKVLLKGMVLPEVLKDVTQHCYIGINLVEPLGLNQLYSLANKFFDYMQAGVPQVTMNFPEYKKVNDEYEVAVLIDTVVVNEIVVALNRLLNDEVLYNRLQQNCMQAREVFTWQKEEQKLLHFYNELFKN